MEKKCTRANRIEATTAACTYLSHKSQAVNSGHSNFFLAALEFQSCPGNIFSFWLCGGKMPEFTQGDCIAGSL